AGLPEYAHSVVRAIGNREPRSVVLVAQSLAGFTAPLVCRQVRVALLVLVNAMIPKPGERPGEWWTNTRHAAAKREQNRRDGRPADAPFDPLVEFFHDVPQPVIDAAWAQGEPRQSDIVFASPCTFEVWPEVPTHVLIARDDRFFPAGFQRRVARERLGISADEMPGGHLVALSQPDELTERLITYATRQQHGT
ncbi:MAG TPA: alpha/beta hydrolase, partial [Candidatus Dormibacteraeota bacterium]|nr:alpha/beta hydrolase [Candidatus Dormibacteraeota bacterium]